MPRTSKLVIVSDGTIKVWDGSSLTAPASGASVMNATGITRSVYAFGKLYLIDDNDARIYNPDTGLVSAWESAVTAGTFPYATKTVAGVAQGPFGIDAVVTGDEGSFEIGEDISTIVATERILITGSTNNNRFWEVASDSGTTVVRVIAGETVGAAGAAMGSLSWVKFARLLALYRGRIVHAGFEHEPHSFYMSKVGDPLDYNTAATPIQTAAVKGTLADFGGPPDVITALIPVSDDVLVFGGGSSIYRLVGDPASGGERELVTDRTGIVWGDAWTKDPFGNIYFFGTNGVFRMNPRTNDPPQSLTQDKLAATMRAIAHTTHEVKLEWDNWYDGLNVYITLSASGASTHYYWDRLTDSWWSDNYPNAHGPMSTLALDGDTPATRGILMGGRDGKVRRISPAAKLDEATAISSEVWIGPIRIGDGAYELHLKKIAVTLGLNTDNMDLSVFEGASPEEAQANPVRFKTNYTRGGRHNLVLRQARGNTFYIKLSNSTGEKQWSVEDILLWVESVGDVKGKP
jgi:hypothetical protein